MFAREIRLEQTQRAEGLLARSLTRRRFEGEDAVPEVRSHVIEHQRRDRSSLRLCARHEPDATEIAERDLEEREVDGQWPPPDPGKRREQPFHRAPHVFAEIEPSQDVQHREGARCLPVKHLEIAHVQVGGSRQAHGFRPRNRQLSKVRIPKRGCPQRFLVRAQLRRAHDAKLTHAASPRSCRRRFGIPSRSSACARAA